MQYSIDLYMVQYTVFVQNPTRDDVPYFMRAMRKLGYVDADTSILDVSK